jgi:hypothetical protein
MGGPLTGASKTLRVLGPVCLGTGFAVVYLAVR